MAESWEWLVVLAVLVVIGLVVWAVFALIRGAVAAGVRKGNERD